VVDVQTVDFLVFKKVAELKNVVASDSGMGNDLRLFDFSRRLHHPLEADFQSKPIVLRALLCASSQEKAIATPNFHMKGGVALEMNPPLAFVGYSLGGRQNRQPVLAVGP